MHSRICVSPRQQYLGICQKTWLGVQTGTDSTVYSTRHSQAAPSIGGSSAVTSGWYATNKAYLEFAHVLADISGEAILPHFRKPRAVKNKAGVSGFDPVTAADRAAERAIRKA